MKFRPGHFYKILKPIQVYSKCFKETFYLEKGIIFICVKKIHGTKSMQDYSIVANDGSYYMLLTNNALYDWFCHIISLTDLDFNTQRDKVLRSGRISRNIHEVP